MKAPYILAAGILITISTPALANQPPTNTHLVSDSELDTMRGGFRFQGMDIRLGADIKTFLNNELALHTVISWSDTGSTQTQTISGALTPADAETLRNNVLANGAIRMNIGNDKVYLANDGQTALIHRTDGALQNVLINTASNVNATQEVNAALDISGYEGFASTITTNQLNNNLGGDVTRAISGAFGR